MKSAIYPFLLATCCISSAGFLNGQETLDFTPQDIGSEQMFSGESDKAHALNFRGDWIGQTHIDKPHYRHSRVDFSTSEIQGSKIVYYDADCREGINLGLTYNHTRFKWNKNPFFQRNHFDQMAFTVSAFSERLCNWSWQAYVTMNWDLKYYKFTDYTNYDLVFWGRYEICPEVFHIHGGFFAQTGMKIDRICPIIGFDWTINSQWKLNAVFPLNLSVVYTFDEHWSAAIAGRIFNVRCRVGRDEPLRQGLLEYMNKGVELACNYVSGALMANIHGGVTFGGQFKISNKEHKKKKHFDLDSSGYLGCEAAVKF